MPTKFHSSLLVAFLNRLLLKPIQDGELDFLEYKKINIRVADANIVYAMTFSNGQLKSVAMSESYDLLLKANVYDFLMLAARKEDADTQVFQRRLVMQGDTELGLELKNFIDGLDVESSGLLSFIESILNKSLPLYRRLFG